MNWMISANGKKYEHASSFAQRGYIDWYQSNRRYNVGDIVYIYSTIPLGKVMYKTRVESIDMFFENITDDKEFWKDLSEYENRKDGKYSRLKLIQQADNDHLRFSFLCTLYPELKRPPQGAQRLSDQLCAYMDQYFNDYYSENFFPDIPDTEDKKITEGVVIFAKVNRYERSSIARSKCIEYNGCYCHVCKMDFEKAYGELGTGFIHVHHITPLHTAAQSGYVVNYKKDLIPVCPNCHAMLHRKFNGKEITIDQLSVMLIKGKMP